MKGSFLVLIISAVISISAVSGNQFVDLVMETYRGGEDINNPCLNDSTTQNLDEIHKIGAEAWSKLYYGHDGAPNATEIEKAFRDAGLKNPSCCAYFDSSKYTVTKNGVTKEYTIGKGDSFVTSTIIDGHEVIVNVQWKGSNGIHFNIPNNPVTGTKTNMSVISRKWDCAS
jgi:hypothetical protein